MVDVRHLDGTRYLVKSREGQIVKNGMYTMIGLGMPIYGKDGEFGNLFIKLLASPIANGLSAACRN